MEWLDLRIGRRVRRRGSHQRRRKEAGCTVNVNCSEWLVGSVSKVGGRGKRPAGGRRDRLSRRRKAMKGSVAQWSEVSRERRRVLGGMEDWGFHSSLVPDGEVRLVGGGVGVRFT
jgi:hypothetical protein